MSPDERRERTPTPVDHESRTPPPQHTEDITPRAGLTPEKAARLRLQAAMDAGVRVVTTCLVELRELEAGRADWEVVRKDIAGKFARRAVDLEALAKLLRAELP